MNNAEYACKHSQILKYTLALSNKNTNFAIVRIKAHLIK